MTSQINDSFTTAPALNLTEQHLPVVCDWLSQQDEALASVVRQYGSPPLWSREPGFASLVHIILEQQVSLESAKAAYMRLEAFTGLITPSNFLKINDEDLLKIGFSRQKRRYVRSLAESLLENRFSLESLPSQPDFYVREALKTQKGIGDWTADIYLTFCLKRPDILPKGDIALYEAIKTLKQLEKRPDYTEFEKLTAHWRPWRSVGTRLLWHFYLCQRRRS